MNEATIQQLSSIKQDTKEGIFTMKGIAFTNLVHSLIREYGKYHDGSYSVDARVMDISDKKLILSHIVDSEEYELATKSITYLEALFKEYLDIIQNYLDGDCDEVYAEDMEEEGLVRRTHYDNGEVYWTRR